MYHDKHEPLVAHTESHVEITNFQLQGARVRRKSVVHAPILVTPEISTPRSSFILSLDSNDIAEEKEEV